MKQIFTLSLLLLLSIIHHRSQAQCVAPSLRFVNPVLVAGTALSEGATYKFPNVAPGIDCYIKLEKLNGGATLISMETPGQGYSDAWQPIIKGPGAPAGNKSWIDWEISFKTTAGDKFHFPCLDIAAIDVDGDNSVTGEFIESDGHTGYNLPNPSYLTLTELPGGRLEAQAPIVNRPSIDTSALDVRITFLYQGKEKVKLKLGSRVFGDGPSATERLNCIYFKRLVMNNYFVLPVNYLSFDAMSADSKITLNWATDMEVNNNHFEVERSLDGIHFSMVAMVMDALSVEKGNMFYGYRDQAPMLAGKSMVYYRLKQVDVKGDYNYSKTILVKLQGSTRNGMQVAPNPFHENLSISFEAAHQGSATFRLQTTSGQTMTSRNITISKGQNTLQVNSLGSLPRGIYIAQLVVNGIVINNQKVIKG